MRMKCSRYVNNFIPFSKTQERASDKLATFPTLKKGK